MLTHSVGLEFEQGVMGWLISVPDVWSPTGKTGANSDSWRLDQMFRMPSTLAGMAVRMGSAGSFHQSPKCAVHPGGLRIGGSLTEDGLTHSKYPKRAR